MQDPTESETIKNSCGAVAIASEFRYDPLSGRWALIAEGRDARPSNTETNGAATSTQEDKKDRERRCPFCRGVESATPETIEIVAVKDGVVKERANKVDDYAIFDAENVQGRDWTIRVVENKYPSLRLSNAINAPSLFDVEQRVFSGELDANERFFQTVPGDGHCEVIVDSTTCARSWSEFSDLRIKLAFRAFRSRLCAMRASKRFEYALVFKNVGPAAGASQRHSHCQLMASATTPSDMRSMLERLKLYEENRLQKGEQDDYWTAALKAELNAKLRIVKETKRFVLFCPFASRFPMQAEARPKFDGAFEDYDDDALDELAALMRDAVKAMERARETKRPDERKLLDYNVVMFNRPYVPAGVLARPRWALLPCIVKKAGYEIGTGIDVNPIAPETAAKWLREALE